MAGRVPPKDVSEAAVRLQASLSTLVASVEGDMAVMEMAKPRRWKRTQYDHADLADSLAKAHATLEEAAALLTKEAH